jgi:hypothetical protein
MVECGVLTVAFWIPKNSHFFEIYFASKGAVVSKERDSGSLTVKSALKISRFLWPEFVREHGCVFLGRESGSNPPPANDTATGWESFVNHVHIFDEFRNSATKRSVVHEGKELDVEDWTYDETHPDFIAACELGRTAAKLWALKLAEDFPTERFRVYYTEYDNPIVRFHKVRTDEPVWISDEALRTSANSCFLNSVIYDTQYTTEPVWGPRSAVH